MHVTLPDDELAAFAVGRRFGIKRVFPGALSCFESWGILRQWACPEMTFLNDEAAPLPAVRVKLNAVARDVRDVAVADRHISPSAGDAMGVGLILVGAVQEMMNAAVFDDHACAKHTHTIAGAVEDLAVAQRHIIRRDLHDVSALALRIDPEVFVHSWFCLLYTSRCV